MAKYHLYVDNATNPGDRRIVSTDDPKDIEREAAYYGLANLRLFTGEIDLEEFAADNPEVFRTGRRDSVTL